MKLLMASVSAFGESRASVLFQKTLAAKATLLRMIIPLSDFTVSANIILFVFGLRCRKHISGKYFRLLQKESEPVLHFFLHGFFFPKNELLKVAM